MDLTVVDDNDDLIKPEPEPIPEAVVAEKPSALNVDEPKEEVVDFEDSLVNSEDQKLATAVDESVENTMSFIKMFTGKYYEGPYKTISEYLEKSVHFEATIEESMQAVEDWYRKEKSRKFAFGFNQGLIEAMEQLLMLKDIMSDANKCSRKSYRVLVKNDRATRGVAHRPPSEIRARGMKRAVDWLVHQYEFRHASECHRIYPIVYEAKLLSMNQDLLKKVELFTTNIIQKRRKKIMFIWEQQRTDDPMILIPTGKAIKRIKGKDIAAAVYRSIQSMASKDPNERYLRKVVNEEKGKLMINDAGLKALFDEYIIKPCEYYVQQLGPDIFVPVKFDIGLLEPYDRYQVEEVQQFFLGWIRFRFCNSILGRDKSSLMKDVARYAAKQSLVKPTLEE